MLSISSDLFEFSDESYIQEFCKPISTMLNTDVLTIGVFDSDFLFLNLINSNTGTDALAKVGRANDIKIKRPVSLNAWKDKVSDFDSFKTAIKSSYVIAEDALKNIEPTLQMNKGQGLFCPDMLSDFDEKQNIHSIFFALPEESTKENMPILEINLYSLMPCEIGRDTIISALNVGGRSKGLAIAFSGNYIENNEIEFHNVQLEYDLGNYPRKTIPLELKKIQTLDNRWIYYAQVTEFRILDKVKDGLSTKKKMDEQFNRAFGVRFTPYGNSRKLLDICVHFIPLKNASGQCCWCVWHMFGSKQNYIEEHNETWADDREQFLNPENFDLE